MCAYGQVLQCSAACDGGRPARSLRALAGLFSLLPEGQPQGNYLERTMAPDAPERNTNMERQHEMELERRPLPTGMSSFTELCDGDYYYVDKTLLIKEIMDHRAKATVFTRPEGFGKSLNMDMLGTFFEISTEDTARYFRDKKIWKCGSRYTDLQGHYPVIRLSFQGLKAPTWDGMRENMIKRLRDEFNRQRSLLDLQKLNAYSMRRFEQFASGGASEAEVHFSLRNLTRILHEAHGVEPIILIDDYDAPIRDAWLAGYYAEAFRFESALLTPALKGNHDLSFACLTGVQHVITGGLYGGLNNLLVKSVLDKRYSNDFGFTKEEVREMADAYGAADSLEKIRAWYGGYRFGDTQITNPWSVVHYFNNDCKIVPYWDDVSSTDILRDVTEHEDPAVIKEVEALLEGKPVWCSWEYCLRYPTIEPTHDRFDPDALWTFLLMSGCLTWTGNILGDGFETIELEIPNREIEAIWNEQWQTPTNR